MRQNTIFADVFNYFIHNGEQVICPECLQELDTRELDIPYGGEKGHKQPAQIKDTDFEKFTTSLKEVLLFIKYSADADKLAEVVAEDREFHHLGREEINVLNVCVNANLPVSQDEEGIDVCKAIEVIAERAAVKAAEKERIDTLADMIERLMDKMEWTAEQAMDILSISEVDRELLLKKI